jgi:hypothetical protein
MLQESHLLADRGGRHIELPGSRGEAERAARHLEYPEPTHGQICTYHEASLKKNFKQDHKAVVRRQREKSAIFSQDTIEGSYGRPRTT